MSNSVDPSVRNLNDCGCCAGVTVETPVEVTNRPGLGAIAYRVGTHALFKESLLARLSGSNLPALRGLKSRDDDDFSIALLDAWATVADVLTFYQERIANESYLRTATERVSLLQLARLIGYELRPGVAASTCLAFTLEDATAPGVPKQTIIDIGTKVQSIPGPNEQPQTFETIEKIEARADWNTLKPKTTELRIPTAGDQNVYLKGVSTNLKVGDGLLLVGKGGEQDFRVIESVTVNQAGGYTLVTWSRGLGSPFAAPTAMPKVYALRQRAALFGANAPDWRTMPDSVKRQYLGNGLFAEYFENIDLTGRVLTRIDSTVDFDWGVGSPDPSIQSDTFSVRWSGFVTPPATGSFTFYTSSDDGVRLWVDGQLIINNWTDHGKFEDTGTIQLEAGRLHDLRLEYYENAGAALISLSWSGPSQPKEIVRSNALHVIDFPAEWPNFNIAYEPSVPALLDTIYLDAIYPKIVPGQDSWLVLTTPTFRGVYQVNSSVDDARAEFTLSSKSTRLKLTGVNLAQQFGTHLRDTVVFGQSELLDYAEQPLRATDTLLKLDNGTLPPVEGSQIALDHFVQGLAVGRRVIVSGKPIRVRITGTINSKDVIPDEGSGAFSVQNGDVPQMIERPSLQLDGRVKLHLMDKNFYTGLLTTSLDNLLLEAANKEDAMVSETVKISALDNSGTLLTLNPGLRGSYDRATVLIYGNVAPATDGETKQEVLGSGDASQPYQQFTLKQSPLTYIASTSPGGADSTLQVRVNDLLWHETPTFYKHGPHERIFVTRTGDDGKTTVEFGDGQTGARLPTGRENVTAKYRKGIGTTGNLKSGQLSLLITRPLGVKSVINPEASTGAADRQSGDDARRNAPLTVLTLDRIVSLQDYEDFARAFSGVAKALATWTWTGEARGVFVTVAGPDGALIPDGSATHDNLVTAMKAAGDPHIPLRVQTYQKAFFKLGVAVKVNPDYETQKVLAAVEQRLRSAFSFNARSFGQAVTSSEVMAIIQAIDGVIAADITKLYRADDPAGPETNDLLFAAAPQAGAGALPGSQDDTISAAELLILSARPLDELGIMT